MQKSIFYENRHLIAYFFIGVSAAVIDVALYIFLYNEIGFLAAVSTTISIAVATVYGFLMNLYFNFKTKDKILSRFISYATVSFVGLFSSTVILFIFSDTLFYNGNYVKILSLPFIFFLQYTLNRKFSFNGYIDIAGKKETQAPEHTDLCNVPKDIAIIGGGFTGLAAGYELSNLGHNVYVYEKADVVGGLASGFSIGEYPLEKAYHFIYQTDEALLAMSQELEIRDSIHFYSSTSCSFFEGKMYSLTSATDLIKYKPLSFVNRIRAGVVVLYLQKTNNWKKLSKVTAMDWLYKWAGKEVTEVIWEPLLKGKFNHFYDKVTMSWLWGRIKIRAKSQNKDFSGEKLGYITGGFQKITSGMSDAIQKKGGSINTNIGVRKIQKDSSDKLSVYFDSGEKKSFDSVLVTTPSNIFAKLISDQKVDEQYLNKLNSVSYLGAVVMVFSTTQKISPYFWHNIKDSRVPFLTLLSTTALAGTEMFGGRHVYYIGSYVPNDHHYFSDQASQIEEEWKEGIRVMFTDFDESQIQSLDVFKFKNAQHIVDIGYEEKKLLPFKTPIGGVYLSNFSQIYPDDRGTNFAIRDGRIVAQQINKYLYEKEK